MKKFFLIVTLALLFTAPFAMAETTTDVFMTDAERQAQIDALTQQLTTLISQNKDIIEQVGTLPRGDAEQMLQNIRTSLEASLELNPNFLSTVDNAWQTGLNTIYNTVQNQTSATDTLSSAQVPTTTTTLTCASFGTLSFRLGDTHAEILNIQRFLNARGITIAETGAGARGNETDYFGERTKAAIIVFQEKYADMILAPLGLSTATGIWGPSTRAQALKLLGCTE